MFGRRDLTRLALGAGAGLALSRAVRAQGAWPDHSLRWVVGYGPGGASDIFARMIARQMGPAIGQSIVVENRPGGGAIVATENVVRSPADGHTLLHTDNGILVYNPALYARLPFDPDKDLVNVGFIGRFPMLLLVRPESPFQDFAGLLAESKRRTITYGTPAVASPHQLAMEVLKRHSGLDATHVPYRGMPAVLNDLVGGQVDCIIADITNALPYLSTGRARGLVMLGDSRASAAPNVPMAVELGYPKAVSYGWQGIAVAAGTPQPVVDRLNTLLRSAIGSPEVSKQMRDIGAELVPRTPAQMAEYVAAENATWRPLIRDLGIRLDG
ncbi:Bug family tripartite tricarboxylate transporter substrate binding protein [Roseomonas populi]|uniref:Tripartite tricarboxylate transporter substrate binding protein n=1 Tax=Roseomonas populi TaxID=3121582 RepID=A0ABT1X588_9PROT|nr:tripartite tricarboxylate transporter substrate binding protein [Roseomonas pecuniae]MCR0983247.1 tripartite tricarboxylate transporter substrate binding protein [Roseomonas pecuniae]